MTDAPPTPNPIMPVSIDTDSAPGGLVSKGLAVGKVGTFSGAILGIASVAPGYTLTASIGLIVAAVGLKMPAIFLAGFIPMFLTAFAFRELNADSPDCGASFTWSTKAFGPYVGWMCGWGLLISAIIVLSNLAAVAVRFVYLLIAGLFHTPGIAELTQLKWVDIGTTLLIIAVATWMSSRGIQTNERVQYVLVGFQLTVILGFAVVAIVAAGQGRGSANLSFSLDWFNPFTGLAMGAFVIGVTGSIFAFWGWDTSLCLGEECTDPKKVPGRAGLLCVVTILLTYLLVSGGVMMYAGVGSQGLGLGNPGNSENALGALARPVLGPWGSPLLLVAILGSTMASLQTTFLPAARYMLAMGAYHALPRGFSAVSPRSQVPVFSTVIAGVVTATFYTIVTLLSERTLLDTIAALGIMVCFYTGITAFACLGYFRKVLFQGLHNIVFKFLFPLLGGIMLLLVFVISIHQSMDPRHGSGASIAGIGLVFYLGFGILLLGFALMVAMRVRQPDFFQGRTLTRSTPALTDDAVIVTASRAGADPETQS
jgi:amino acid transporter